MLSLQPPGSPCHNVTALYSGLYVPVHLFPGKHINVYAHPWSRGWSIFADEAPRPAFGVPPGHSNPARSLQLAPRIQAVHGPAAPAVLPARQDWPLARTTRADRRSYHRHHRPPRSPGPHPTSTLPQETLVLSPTRSNARRRTADRLTSLDVSVTNRHQQSPQFPDLYSYEEQKSWGHAQGSAHPSSLCSCTDVAPGCCGCAAPAPHVPMCRLPGLLMSDPTSPSACAPSPSVSCSRVRAGRSRYGC
jgi:hypothetical protein